ncbi:MAG: ABC transporter substrate-binding protein [Candidatus Lokiarchaeota archaeon]|nr:ABC transporter substrate-binding protein [Candidatus Lokiarchaeota archaeon]
MELEKKDFTVIVLSFCIIISSGVNIILGIQLGRYYNQRTTPDKEILIVGTPSGPTVLDPVDSWESPANDVIRQVAEPLWYYNLTDINMDRINMLSESEQWINTTALSVTLRKGVRFHDGTPFNADTVKWNIDRLLYLCNHTGQLSSEERRATPHFLYEDPTGNPLLSHVEITGIYECIIHLAQPFSSLMNLMCFTSSVMLSPTAHAEDATSFIDLATGRLVGTGPYMYDKYIAEREVIFTRWDEYWRDLAMFKELKFKIIGDEIIRNYELLVGKIDYLRLPSLDFFESFKTNSKVTFYEHQKPGLGYGFLNFNNENINVTWRKAMSYAFNYTYIIEDYYQGRFVRSYGPISLGFGKYYDPAIVNTAPYYNLTIARQTIIDDPGIDTTGLTANNDPDDENWLNADLASFNFSFYKYCDEFKGELYILLRDWFDAIGITIIGTSDWAYFLWLYPHPDELDLFWRSCYLDYLDPIDLFVPLYSNASFSNYALVNDRKLEQMISDSINELNETLRIETYKNISHYLAGELYPDIFVYQPKIYYAFAADLYDVPYNSFGKFYACQIKRNLTWDSIN